MKKITFKIPYPSTQAGMKQWAKEYGTNAYYAGKHWSKRKKDAEYWHWLVRSEIKKQEVPVKLCKHPVYVSFSWNDRLDVDNHTIMGKFIVDALKGVLIVDDDRKHLVGVQHVFHEENYVLVEIEEVS